MMNGENLKQLVWGKNKVTTREFIREDTGESQPSSPVKEHRTGVQGSLTWSYFYLRQNTLEALQAALEGTRGKENISKTLPQSIQELIRFGNRRWGEGKEKSRCWKQGQDDPIDDLTHAFSECTWPWGGQHQDDGDEMPHEYFEVVKPFNGFLSPGILMENICISKFLKY
ncbi:uncharacterized protein LOC121488670 isoform X3 [Vulpes lagopus]|uniref:uncharacterized protein LOC121488670 isoform X3 n=1 Tax=Vulpes lagopus TaxID=494514 RepID=UPI001BC936ED|nr:uncharacterized protein LOC121488670 isoform X3 [Vulpes lagopus]